MKKKLSKSEIIKQAKHYFGKDRSFIKELVLSYKFDGSNYKQWKQKVEGIITNPNKIIFNLSNDVVHWIKDNKVEEINWNWIGDLSWTIDIVLNSNIDKGYDWDKKLALKCNGTARMLTIFISEVIPCYTYDCYYSTYNKRGNYYEYGPISNLTNDEKYILKKIKTLLKNKGLQSIEKAFSQRRFKELYSDVYENGNASLFDVLFTDMNSYTSEIKRFSDKEIIEKSGNKFQWKELYKSNGILKERIESRWTSGGDYFNIILDSKGCITEVNVTRKKIERKKFQTFNLNIIDSFKKRKRAGQQKKNDH